MSLYDDLGSKDFVNPYRQKIQDENVAKVKELEARANSSPSQNQPILPPKKFQTGNKIFDAVGNTLDAFNNLGVSKGINALGLAVQKGIGMGAVNKLINPEQAKKDQERMDQYPTISTVGQGIGYLAPFGLAGKAVSKIPAVMNSGKSIASGLSKIPGLAKVAPSIGRIGQGAIKAGVEGVAVGGALEGADAAVDYLQGNATSGDVGRRALQGARDFGLGGAAVGGAIPAVGEAFKLGKNLNQLRLDNKQLKAIDNAYDSFKINSTAPKDTSFSAPKYTKPNAASMFDDFDVNGLSKIESQYKADALKIKRNIKDPKVREAKLADLETTYKTNKFKLAQNGNTNALVGDFLDSYKFKVSPTSNSRVPPKRMQGPQPLNTQKQRPNNYRQSGVQDPEMIPPNARVNETVAPYSTTTTPPTSTPPSTGGKTPTIDRIVTTPTGAPTTFKQKLSNAYKRMFDGENDIANFGKAAGDRTAHETALNSKKVSGTVEYVLNDDLVNANGVKVGEGLKSIVKSIPKGKEQAFDDYLLHKHNIDRFRENKPIFSDYDSAASLAEVKRYEASNPEFRELSDRIYKFVNTFMDEWGAGTGLTNKNLLADLRKTYKNYVPTNREFSQLESGMNAGNAKSGYVNQPSTIRRATGSDRNVISPIENIMGLVNRTVRTARRNQVGQEMYKAIKSNPDKLKAYAEILPDNYVSPEQYAHFNGGRTDLGNVVSIQIDGKPVYIRVNKPELLETLNSLSNSSYQAPELIKKTSTLFKGLITQYNPLFALGNMAVDIPSSYVYGTEQNPFKFARDLYRAGKGMAKNSKEFQQYKALGGKSENFFSPAEAGKLKSDMLSPKPFYKQPIKTLLNPISKFNNATETLPRFAEFQRSLAKGATPQKALYNAGEATVNFARGGTTAKNIDQFVPYFNASMQGLDRGARALMNNPKAFFKAGLIGMTLPTTVMYLINKDNPEYQKLDNRTKDAFFLFPREDGTFFKIRKSRELGVLFGSLFERIYRKAEGDENAFKGFGTSIRTNFTPVNPVDNNLASPFINLRANKDFADREIVPRYMLDDGRSKYLQYDEKTLQITKKIAEEANRLGVDLSPKQMDYIIKSYTGVVGQLTTGDNPLKSAGMKFTADPAYSNQSTTDFYDNKDRLNQKATDKNILENIPSKTKTEEEARRNNLDLASKYMNFIRKTNKNADDKQKRQAQIQINTIADVVNKNIKTPPTQLKSTLFNLKPKGYK